MPIKEENKWRKCGRCIADGRPECHVAIEKAESPEKCKGPFRGFEEMKRRERKERERII